MVHNNVPLSLLLWVLTPKVLLHICIFSFRKGLKFCENVVMGTFRSLNTMLLLWLLIWAEKVWYKYYIIFTVKDFVHNILSCIFLIHVFFQLKWNCAWRKDVSHDTKQPQSVCKLQTLVTVFIIYYYYPYFSLYEHISILLWMFLCSLNSSRFLKATTWKDKTSTLYYMRKSGCSLRSIRHKHQRA